MQHEENHLKLILLYILKKQQLLLATYERELNTMPKGTLIQRKKGTRYYFTLRDQSGEHGITNDTDTIRKLLRKEYLLQAIPNIKKHITILSKYIDRNLSLEYASRFNCKFTIDDIMLTDKQLSWVASSNSQNPYKTNQLIYKTRNGIFVRSKSELLIANKLHDYGLIFKYEAPFETESGTIYPDFTILRDDEEIIIWEHNGLVSNEEYFLKTIQRIRKYNKYGFVQHKNLICTEESDMIDEATLDDIIFRYIIF